VLSVVAAFGVTTFDVMAASSAARMRRVGAPLAEAMLLLSTAKPTSAVALPMSTTRTIPPLLLLAANTSSMRRSLR
jgi:hypothetical protein